MNIQPLRLTRCLVSVIALFAIGCAAPSQPLMTPSGRPEIYLHDVSRKQAVDLIVERAATNGMTIKSVSDYGVVLTKRAEGDFSAKLIYGSRYDSVPEYRITFTIVDTSGGIKVFSNAVMVTNPGSAFEKVNDVTETTKHQQQDMLLQMRARLQSP